jgi:hypothetical protein
MKIKTIGSILLAGLILTVIILIIEINFYNDTNLNKYELNIILFWSFIKGLTISIAVSIGNNIRLSKKR